MLLKQDGRKGSAGCPAVMLPSENCRIRPASPSSELEVISPDECRPHERAVASPAMLELAGGQHSQKSCTPGKGEAPWGTGLQRGHVSGEINEDEAQATGAAVNAH